MESEIMRQITATARVLGLKLVQAEIIAGMNRRKGRRKKIQ